MKGWAVTFAIAATMVGAVAVPAGAAQRSTSPVLAFSNGAPVPGASSTLVRNQRGVGLRLRTSELPADQTATVWYVIFNEPQHCSHPAGAHLNCGPGDLPPNGGDDSAVTSFVYAAGHRVGESGRAGFGDHLRTGDTSDALWGPGLIAPLTAEIHIVVRDESGAFIQFSTHPV